MAVISCDCSATLTCPSPSRCALAPALTIWLAAGGGGPITGSTRRCPIDGHDLAASDFAQRLGPCEETPGQLVGVQLRKDAPQGVMTGHPIRQLHEVRAPRGVGVPICFEVFPAVRAANHCPHRNAQDIHQQRTAMGGIRAAGIGEGGKRILKRGRSELTHEARSSLFIGIREEMTPIPSRKTRCISQCACPGKHPWASSRRPPAMSALPGGRQPPVASPRRKVWRGFARSGQAEQDGGRERLRGFPGRRPRSGQLGKLRGDMRIRRAKIYNDEKYRGSSAKLTP
jgi:hypothetical protein